MAVLDYFTADKFREEIPNIRFLVIAVASFFVARWVVRDWFCKKLLRSLGVKQVQKAIEFAWYFIYYVIFTAFGIYVYSQESWSVPPTANFWRGYPHPLSNTMWTYYLLELSFYFHGLIAISYEVRRKDFKVMVTHHVVTIWLICHSYWMRLHRVGMITLIIHNISDNFLYGGKVFHYISKAHPSINPFVQALFVIFAVSFFLTRLIAFPALVIYPAYFESNVEFPGCPGCKESVIVLGTLFALHCMWFAMIVKMAVGILRKPDNVIDDVCSEDEEEEEDKQRLKNHRRKPIKNAKEE